MRGKRLDCDGRGNGDGGAIHVEFLFAVEPGPVYMMISLECLLGFLGRKKGLPCKHRVSNGDV